MIHVKLGDRSVEYEFDLYDKYTLVKGDSATGKTSLYDLFSTYYDSPDAVRCQGYNKLRTLPKTKNLKEMSTALNSNSNFIFIADETHPFLHTIGFEKMLEESDNYFIIMCREKIFKNLSIHIRSIVQIINSGKYHRFSQIYTLREGTRKFTKVITEDSKSGKIFLSQFLSNVVDAGTVIGKKSSGKDCIPLAIEKCSEDICIVFDKSGIGATYDDILKKYKYYEHSITELAWESFEAYLLSTQRYKLVTLDDYDCRYDSYEKYATKHMYDILLVFPGKKYDKDTLYNCFRVDGCFKCSKQKFCPYFSTKESDLIEGRVKKLIDVGVTL